MSKKNQGPTAVAFLLVLALRAFDAAAADETSARCELNVSSEDIAAVIPFAIE